MSAPRNPADDERYLPFNDFDAYLQLETEPNPECTELNPLTANVHDSGHTDLLGPGFYQGTGTILMMQGPKEDDNFSSNIGDFQDGASGTIDPRAREFYPGDM